MKPCYLIILVISIFTGCGKKQQISIEETSTTSISAEAFRDSLSRYPKINASSLRGLELFKRYGDKQNPEQCDKALNYYLVFQARLIDTLNNKLTQRPDFEKLNSLVYGDSNLHEAIAQEYEKELNRYGLLFKSTEGTIYIDRDPEIIKTYFLQYLTPATQEFLIPFLEEAQGFQDDGSLTVAPIDLADRLAFWDNFLSKYPNHLFADVARNKKNHYLFYLLDGLDNTPAFNFESKKLNKEFLDGYTSMIKKHSALSTSKVIAEYLELLKLNDFHKTVKVEEFIKKYSIY